MIFSAQNAHLQIISSSRLLKPFPSSTSQKQGLYSSLERFLPLPLLNLTYCTRAAAKLTTNEAELPVPAPMVSSVWEVRRNEFNRMLTEPKMPAMRKNMDESANFCWELSEAVPVV